MISFILIAIFIIYRGVTLYYQLEDKRLRMLVMSMLLGLITYFIHGILVLFAQIYDGFIGRVFVFG